jgi:hypothetical protein
MNRVGDNMMALFLHKGTQVLLDRHSLRVLLYRQDKLTITCSYVLRYFQAYTELSGVNSGSHVE